MTSCEPFPIVEAKQNHTVPSTTTSTPRMNLATPPHFSLCSICRPWVKLFLHLSFYFTPFSGHHHPYIDRDIPFKDRYPFYWFPFSASSNSTYASFSFIIPTRPLVTTVHASTKLSVCLPSSLLLSSLLLCLVSLYCSKQPCLISFSTILAQLLPAGAPLASTIVVLRSEKS